ncbi:tyrosine protein phosphatase [Listeria monocytogenes]|nr:tyrosine protein phosphatase [Listeria monocytogenes]EKA2555512.1 tyrosine protein phosphatase [Listeria monocytogenes]EKA2558670.1 tyrosine protein phosphatase [Listeria monocytogenes]EKA2561793.1 tyrosine protein phosphatase [Listeria monocytogenes]EKA2564961.1 tyrosine protein phosphatase [Listeria monocytogenes]
MIDIHCHILNQLDDGANSMEQSILMAQQAVENGFTNIIATPHYLDSLFNAPGNVVLEATQKLRNILLQLQIPLTIHSGQEIAITNDIAKNIFIGENLSLANSKYVLIELPAHDFPIYTEEILFQLLLEGYIPVIAHPERNQKIIDDPTLIRSLVNRGSLVQITWGSLNGYFGKKSKKLCEYLLKNNLVHFIATDAHDIYKRSFNIIEAKIHLKSIISPEQQTYLQNNNIFLLQNKPIKQAEFKPLPSKRLFSFLKSNI